MPAGTPKSWEIFSGVSGQERKKRAKTETRERKDPGAEKEGKYSSGFCLGHFARAAMLSLKT